MMPNDNGERARDEATTFEGLHVVHAWDPMHHLGDLYAKTLSLDSTAWDVYFLYTPGVQWKGNEPPQPTIWMHQLPAASGADRTLVLYPTRLSQELLKLLGDGVEPGHVSRADLGLQLHERGLANLVRERGPYTLEDIRQAVEDSKIET